MPRVSVIIPTYNRGYIVNDAIASILAQTMGDFEILMVDDGSTDDTRRVIDTIADERIRYIYEENGGVSSARNLGIVRAKGTYIAFLDSDDVWPECFLEATSYALDASQDHGLAYTATVQEFPDGRKETDNLKRCVSGQVTIQLFMHSTIWPMAVLIRRSVLDDFWLDENLMICDDNDAFMRLSTITRFIFVPDVYVTRHASDDRHSNALYTYVSDPKTSQSHGNCSLDYYMHCVQELAEAVDQPHYFVLSDEPRWACANLKLDAPVTIIDHNGTAQAYEDLRLMRHCRHHIIANSSFSGWGAWLNPRPDKLVYAPKQWFSHDKWDFQDVVATRWQQR